MVVESTSVKTIIDLLESLRKNSFTASSIRVSYTLKGSKKRYVTFNSLDELKQNYTNNYLQKVQSRKSPYTADPRLALQEPVSKTVGQQIFNTFEPYQIYFESAPFFCKTGSLVTLESFNISSYVQGYEISFIARDITGIFKLLDGSRFDLRRQSEILSVVDRFKSSVIELVSNYNSIFSRLKFLFDKGQYVELCYVTIGYVEYTFELYKLFFTINKRPLNAGIDLSVLQKMYLRATE